MARHPEEAEIARRERRKKGERCCGTLAIIFSLLWALSVNMNRDGENEKLYGILQEKFDDIKEAIKKKLDRHLK